MLATIAALRDKENSERRFLAAIQGIDIEEETAPPQDITTLSGGAAVKAGFGIGMGLGYEST